MRKRMTPDSVTQAGRLAIPLAAAVGLWLLGAYFIAPGVDAAAISRGLISPVTWPKFMLYSAALCAAALFVRELRAVLTAPSPGDPAGKPGAGYHELRSLLGIAVLAAYALAIPVVGIAWATLVFIAAWLVLGGMRKPVVIFAVSGIGTTALLYLFVRVSLMPLDRGQGVFEQATVTLYRVLRIY
jgi:putative tricarboxylic transport membrane protein